ncbi:hypothetical protein ACFE04_027637 [Oxalis oulophora]
MIKCDACEKAEAEVLCCADEAVLCKGCDEKIHAANKLSKSHQRVALLKHPPSSSFSSQLPLCDICQERKGYFFCLEDRAILCKHCDTSTHVASPFVSSHQRFFFGGVKVALQSSTSDDIGCSQSSISPNSDLSSGFPTSAESRFTMTQDIDQSATATSDEIYFPSDHQHWSLDDIFNAATLNNYDFPDIPLPSETFGK